MRLTGEISADLEGNHPIQRSKVVNHPEYLKPVLMTQYGWAKRNKETFWYETKIEQILEEV
jgi:hypothetical protein